MLSNPSIIYQDADILVLNKPSGMIVNRADTTKDVITLQDWVEKSFQFVNHISMPQKNEDGTYNPEYEFYSRSGIVHRLDKETSGIILVAKNVKTFIQVQQQFKSRLIIKAYQALTHGVITPSNGEISVPIGRLPYNRTHFGIVAGGREACTHYTTLNHFEITVHNRKEKLTLVEVNPKTGRTHQIRVHLKYINHPIFSDPLYAGRKISRDDRKLLDRVFLHAHSITFMHPCSHEPVSFNCELPNELKLFLSKLTLIS